MQTRSWEKDGQKHYRTEVIADRVQFGPRSGGEGAPAASTSAQNNEPAPAAPEYPEEDINPDDIPF